MAALATSTRRTARVALLLAGVATGVLVVPSLGHAATRSPAETLAGSPAGKLTAGYGHTCHLSEGGAVRCWGANDDGQLGDGTTTDRTTPVIVLANAVAVAAGGNHTCALLADGGVRCWGDNTSGRLGVGGFLANVLTPAAVVGLPSMIAIDAGVDHTCGLHRDGGATCWGSDYWGQLGDGDGTEHRPVLAMGPLTTVTAGAAHSCALGVNGAAQCFGSNSHGQLGNGTGADSTRPVLVSGLQDAVGLDAGTVETCAVKADRTLTCWGDFQGGRKTPEPFGSLTSVSQVAAGERHSCALVADGRVRCWGENVWGQLGDGTIEPRTAPTAVAGLTNAVTVAVGIAHSCATLANGAVVCWGANHTGQLGNGTTSGSSTPTAVAGGGGTVTGTHIAAGGSHSCAVRASGTVACWGANGFGQLGLGTTAAQLVPAAAPLSDVTAVATGGGHTCALVAGNVRCWGANSSGQVGDGTSASRFAPVPVGLPGAAMLIATGEEHTCALLATGVPSCWGRNADGQLGDGSLISRSTPVISHQSGVTAIAAGRSHTCALVVGGVVRCWGDNGSGQLGDGTTADRILPTPVVGISTAVAIAAGDSHSCALLVDGTARCWGGNTSGQVGDGGTSQRVVPATPIGVTNAVGITAGGSHTCAVLADGTASCWGANARGQLGDGTTTQRLVPTPVTIQLFQRTFTGGSLVTLALGGVLQVTAGRAHTCAVSTNGSVRCWGASTSGELGLGSTTDQLRPLAVPSFTLNIEPLVALRANGRVATVEVIAICEAGERLHAEVRLTQGEASGRGVAVGECTGAVARYRATVPARGRSPFGLGPATVVATATTGHGSMHEQHAWSRGVQLILSSAGP